MFLLIVSRLGKAILYYFVVAHDVNAKKGNIIVSNFVISTIQNQSLVLSPQYLKMIYRIAFRKYSRAY